MKMYSIFRTTDLNRADFLSFDYFHGICSGLPEFKEMPRGIYIIFPWKSVVANYKGGLQSIHRVEDGAQLTDNHLQNEMNV